MNVQRTVPQVTRLGRAAHPHLSLPATSQLTKPWSRGQRRSCRTCHCLLDQPVLSKEVKDQEGRRLMIFWGWGERERRKGQKIMERALARLLLKAAVQLHLCLSSAAKHQWTWTSGTGPLRRMLANPACVSVCENLHTIDIKKPLDKGFGVVTHCRLMVHQYPPWFRAYHCIYCGVAYT